MRVYEKYKGKEAHASKEWAMTKGEKTALIVFMAVLFLFVLAVIVLQFLPITTLLKILAFILCIIVFFVGTGLFVLIIVLRHNKKDPAEMHYFDVDYEYNRFKNEVNDNTKEITKEDFYSKE